jgi:hypothetical protein
MMSPVAPAPASLAAEVLLDCALLPSETDTAASTMRRLEEAFMDAIQAGEEDPARGHEMAVRLLSMLPLMVDSDSNDGRMRRFARAVARTAMTLADRQDAEVVTRSRDSITRICDEHAAPCLRGMLEPIR